MPGDNNATASVNWALRLQSRANGLNLALRNFLRWTPPIYREAPAGQLDLSAFSAENQARAEELLSRYGLQDLPKRACRQRCLETLTYLDWLDGTQQAQPDWFAELAKAGSTANQPPGWLDVGAKNWAYVEALAAFAKALNGENFRLEGVELDPHRRYTNGQTRGQAARAFIESIPQAQYHAGDIRDWRQPAHVITLFLPFVFEEPHLAWGLPLNYFQPKDMLAHVLAQLEPGGVLLVVNQGEVEAEAQAQLFQTLQFQAVQNTHPLEVVNLGELPGRFIDYRYPRFGWLCHKAQNAPGV